MPKLLIAGKQMGKPEQKLLTAGKQTEKQVKAQEKPVRKRQLVPKRAKIQEAIVQKNLMR